MYNKVCMLVIFLCVLAMIPCRGLDVSWVPSDPDGPLPLSSNYRLKLQHLCEKTEHGYKLPEGAEIKKASIIRICKQLQQSAAYDYPSVPQNALSGQIGNVLIICVAIGAVWLYFSRKNLNPAMNNWSASVSQSSSRNIIEPQSNAFEKPSEEQLRLAREARMQRFGSSTPVPKT